MTDSQKDFQDQVDAFETTVTILNGVLEDHKSELNKAKNVAKTGVLVGILGIVVGLIGGAVGFDGRNMAQEIQATRAEARISSCIQANVATKGNRDSLISAIVVFANDPTDLTPKEQAVLAAYTDKVETALPYRDCSPSGIVNYYENPPSDPAEF